jgi:hypothetical protein
MESLSRVRGDEGEVDRVKTLVDRVKTPVDRVKIPADRVKALVDRASEPAVGVIMRVGRGLVRGVREPYFVLSQHHMIPVLLMTKSLRMMRFMALTEIFLRMNQCWKMGTEMSTIRLTSLRSVQGLKLSTATTAT